MICPKCGEPFTDVCSCGWLHASPVPSRPVYQSPAPGITKEDFGLLLYQTLETIGGLLGLEQQRAAAIHHGQKAKVAGLLKRRKELQVTLAKQLPALAGHECDAILETYPWVTRC